MFLRVFTAAFVLSATAMAADSRPVCPGPAALGTARCHSRVVTGKDGKPQASSVPLAGAYGPTQFQTAYGLDSANLGGGQTIAIVDAYDDPNIEQDLGVAFARA